MSAILIILLAASFGHALGKALRLPHVPLLILSGGLLDYFNAPIEPSLAKDALLLGLIFLVFLAGTALNPWRVGVRAPIAILIGASQFFALGAVGLVFCLAIGLSLVESLYIALALASSSTLVVIKILQTRGELFEPFGRLMVGALLVQDFLMILVISALSNLGEGKFNIAISVGLLLALGMLGVIFKKYVVPWLLLSKGVDEEIQLVLALGILFFFMGISNFFNLPFLAGAFIAGISLSSFPVNGVLKGQFASLNNFFSAIFFVMLGFFVNFPPIDSIGTVIWLSFMVVFITPLITAGMALAAGMTLRTGAEAGLLLAQTSEFSIILMLTGMANGDLGQGHLSMVTSITVATMIITPFLSNERTASLVMRTMARFPRREEGIKRLKNHYVLVGCGESAMVVLKKLLGAGVEVAVIDDDAGVIKHVRELGAYAILGNGKDPSVLERAFLGSSTLVVSSMRKIPDNKNLLKYTDRVPIVIRVFDQWEAMEFENQGAIAIPATDAASEDLLAWMESDLKRILCEHKGC